jgi:hypothetical protein
MHEEAVDFPEVLPLLVRAQVNEADHLRRLFLGHEQCSTKQWLLDVTIPHPAAKIYRGSELSCGKQALIAETPGFGVYVADPRSVIVASVTNYRHSLIMPRHSSARPLIQGVLRKPEGSSGR